jgi:hypothetical protein
LTSSKSDITPLGRQNHNIRNHHTCCLARSRDLTPARGNTRQKPQCYRNVCRGGSVAITPITAPLKSAASSPVTSQQRRSNGSSNTSVASIHRPLPHRSRVGKAGATGSQSRGGRAQRCYISASRPNNGTEEPSVSLLITNPSAGSPSDRMVTLVALTTLHTLGRSQEVSGGVLTNR